MAKVKKRFKDKETLKVYRKGEEYPEENEQRVAYLVEKGFLEKKENPSSGSSKTKASKKK